MAIAYYNPYYNKTLKTIPVVSAAYGVQKPATKRIASYTGTMVQKKRRQQRSVSLKTLIKRTEPAKHYTWENNAALLHNTLYTCIPTQGITQGTSITNRLADSVYLCALKISGQFLSATTAGAYSMRIIVGWTGEEVTTAGIASGLVSGLGLGDVFLSSTAGIWTANGQINSKAFTTLYDQTIDINSQISAVSDISSFNITVPLNQSFYYQAAGFTQGKTRNLCVLVVAGVAYGTTGVTAAGNCIWSADLIFKD